MAALVGSGWEEGGVDEDEASEWPTGDDGDWSLEEERASTLMRGRRLEGGANSESEVLVIGGHML